MFTIKIELKCVGKRLRGRTAARVRVHSYKRMRNGKEEKVRSYWRKR